MTSGEFQQWLQHHFTRFTGFAKWFTSFPAEQPTIVLTQESISQGWYETLWTVALEDALAATDAMANGEEPEPKSFDAHAREVKRIARNLERARVGSLATNRPEPVMVDGEWTYRCPDCRDSGTVTCYAGKTISAARRGLVRDPEHNPTGTQSLYTCAVPCHCGHPVSRQAGWKGVAMFDRGDRLHLAVPHDLIGTRYVWTHLHDQLGVAGVKA